MAHIPQGTGILYVTYTIDQGFALCGPYFNIAFDKETPPHILNDIITRSQCLEYFDDDCISIYENLIKQTLKTVEPGGAEILMKTQTDLSRHFLTIRAFVADESALQSSLATQLDATPHVWVSLFILSTQPIPEIWKVETRDDLVQTAKHWVLDGKKLPWEFSDQFYLYDQLAAAQEATTAAMRLRMLGSDAGEGDFWDLGPKLLPGLRVGGMYDRNAGQLVALAVIQKVIVSKDRVVYRDIEEDE